MKYNDNGTVKNIIIKAGDTLPIGTIVEYEGITIPDGYTVVEDKGEIYSTDEVRIGTFLGKPLYRKLINFGTLPNATYKAVSHNISNLDLIVNIYGIAVRSDKTTLPLPYTGSNYVELYGNNTELNIMTNNDRSSFTGYITIEYTKTTD